MSKQSFFPVVITKQLNGAIYVKANGRHFGFTTLNYSFHDSSIVHSIALETDEAVITDFPEGVGRYNIWLGAPDGRQSALMEFYYNRDSDIAVYKKILSYIYNQDGKEFAAQFLGKIRSTRIGYTYQIVKEFLKIKKPTSHELESFYNIIAVAERYENTMAISFNRTYLSNLSCYYEAQFSFTPPPSFTSMDVFCCDTEIPTYCYSQKIRGGQNVHLVSAPGHLYQIDFYCGAELVLTLHHYQLDEAGAAYLWTNTVDAINADAAMLDDTELSHSGIELSAEDKKRIIEERKHEPANATVERPLVEPTPLDPCILNVIIRDFSAIEASSGNYYLSIVESDLYDNGSFDHRLPITDSVIKVDSRQLMLGDEIILCIKDEKGTPVSKYVRHQLNYTDSDIDEYNEKRTLVELHEYGSQLLDEFKGAFGAGELYNRFADVVMPLCKDEGKTVRDTFDSIILAVGRDQRLAKERANILFFVEDNWMKHGVYDAEFFPEKPAFYYAEGRLTLPNNLTDYLVCVERYDTFNGTVTRDYISSAQSSGISVNVINADFCCVHAVDIESHKSSGRLFFNNLGGHEYYRDQIDMEVIIYHG